MKDTFTTPWKRIAQTWKAFGPGARPSKGNIKTFEKWILKYTRGKKSPRVLVMGATPEIRDMLARHRHVQVTILDVNLEMMRAMTELMRESSEREVWVRADWLTAPLEHGYFDVVIGDYIKGNLPYAKQPALYHNIAHWLKPNGVYMERIYSWFPELRIHDIGPVIARFSKRKPALRQATNLWHYVMFLTQPGNKDPKTNTAFAVLDRYASVPNMKTYRNMLYDLMPPGKSWAYHKPWKEDQKPVTASFKILEEAPDDTLLKDRTRLFVFRPKK